MRKIITVIAVAAFLCAVVIGCLDEKVFEIVLFGETTHEIHHEETSASATDPDTVDYADEIDKILKDANWRKSDIKSVKVVSAFYGVTDWVVPVGHDDWELEGYAMVRRLDVPSTIDTMVEYTYASVKDALDRRIQAVLQEDGVEILDTAFEDYLGGSSPVLEFSVLNGVIDPTPSDTDKLDVHSKFWIKLHVIKDESAEFPDPF
jgi:DNA-binding MltR family transcriptional regulator